jgi:hypothetical protein
MNDEQQLRALLLVAAEPPDEMRPPVQSLLQRARRRRTTRAALSVAAAATAVVVAFGAVAVEALTHLSGPSSVTIHTPGGLFGTLPPAPSGPTEGQIFKFRWSTLPPTPIGTHTSSTVVWADRELFQIYYGVGSTPGAAAVYRPAAGRWFKIASPPRQDSNVVAGATVWTGHELFVADGRSECGQSGCATFVDLYSPAANRWTSTRMPKAMTLLAPQAAVWTGRYVIVAALPPQGGGGLAVAAYAPATGRWQMITPRLPRGHRSQGIAMVATSDRVILWSLWSHITHSKHGGAASSGVDVLATSQAGSWTDITGGWPQGYSVTDPVFTSHGILVSQGQIWCGYCSHPPAVVPGYFADPTTLHRTTIRPGPLGAVEPSYTWTGQTIIAFDLNDMISGTPNHLIRPDAVALYDPGRKSWHSLPAPPGKSFTLASEPVWTGSELLVLTSSGRLLAFGPQN